MPMLNVVVQTTVSATIKAAAAANTGRQRAASHNSSGNSAAIGTTVAQGSLGTKMITPQSTISIASAAVPSMISPRGEGSRAEDISPISNGATVITPSASDVNQWYQMVSGGVVEVWNRT